MSRAPAVEAESAGRYATPARRIAVSFETPAQLAHGLRVDTVPWELVVDGHTEEHVGIGDPVRLSVEVRGHTPHLVRGVVIWRRVRRGRGYPEAIGVRIDPSEVDVVARLRRIALGQFEDDARDVLRWRAAPQHRFA